MSTVLFCRAGVWTEGIHCPPSACAKVDGLLQCANGGFSVGDYCTATTAGSLACSTDLTAILTCKDGKTVLHQQCSPKQCTSVEGGVIECR
jgi:hypothetical protein